MFCASCGKQMAGDATFCSSCGALVGRTQEAQAQAVTPNPARVTGEELKPSANYSIGGLALAFGKLDTKRALSASLVFAAIFDLCVLFGVHRLASSARQAPGLLGMFFGSLLPESPDIPKLLALGLLPFVNNAAALALARLALRGSGGLGGDSFTAGASLLPFGFFILASSLLGAGNLEVMGVLFVFALCYTISILFIGCTRLSKISDAGAALAVPMVLLVSSYICKVVLTSVWSDGGQKNALARSAIPDLTGAPLTEAPTGAPAITGPTEAPPMLQPSPTSSQESLFLGSPASQLRERKGPSPTRATSEADAGSTDLADTEIGADSDFATYRDESHGWSLEHPTDWQVDRKDYEDGRRRIEITAPSPDVKIIVDVSPGQASDAAADWESLDGRFRNTYGSRYQLIDLNSRALGGQPGARWEFMLRKKGEPLLHKIDYGTSYNGDGYAVLFAAPAEDFETWRSVFDRVYLSFRLGD